MLRWSLSRAKGPLLLAAAGLALAGCNAPYVALKPLEAQHSATHILDGDRAAVRIVDAMQERGLLPVAAPAGQAAPAPQRPFYIHVASDGSTFLRVLKPALEGEIIRRGGAVERSAARATVLNLETEVVNWAPRTPRGNAPFTTLGGIGAAAGVLADNAPLTVAEAAAAGIAFGVVADVALATAPRFNAEIALLATVYQGDRLTFQAREPMYVHANDVPLFLGRGRLAPLSTPAAQASLPVRQIRYAR